jgi:hypothetical protein
MSLVLDVLVFAQLVTQLACLLILRDLAQRPPAVPLPLPAPIALPPAIHKHDIHVTHTHGPHGPVR